ncbi:unnamed protein product [Amaranthus hypochondriacus]
MAANLPLSVPIPSSSTSVNPIFASVPTRTEAENSLAAFQSYMNHEGSSMLVENPGIQLFETTYQLMKQPLVQEVVISLLTDEKVLDTIRENEAVQNCIRGLTQEYSAPMLTNTDNTIVATNTTCAETEAETPKTGKKRDKFKKIFYKVAKSVMEGLTVAATNIPQAQRSNDEHDLVKNILSWLLENMDGLQELFYTVNSHVDVDTFESPQPKGSNSKSKHELAGIAFLYIINLIILLVARGV